LAVASNPRATSGTSGKAFVDSNVLIYGHDADAGRKRDVAKGLLRDLWLTRTGVLSTQVLHEFYINVTREIRTPLSKVEARRVVGTYLPWCLAPEAGDVNEAFRIEDEAGISFWDALIVAAAARSGATRVLSEDLNPGQLGQCHGWMPWQGAPRSAGVSQRPVSRRRARRRAVRDRAVLEGVVVEAFGAGPGCDLTRWPVPDVVPAVVLHAVRESPPMSA
jgi:predicted nucleic acid-binding protein